MKQKVLVRHTILCYQLSVIFGAEIFTFILQHFLNNNELITKCSKCLFWYLLSYEYLPCTYLIVCF